MDEFDRHDAGSYFAAMENFLERFVWSVYSKDMCDSLGLDVAYLINMVEKIIIEMPEALAYERYDANMSGEEFEAFCADLLELHGWSVKLTRKTGDQGADILASKGERYVAIQCKRYSSSVGNSAIQQALAAKLHYDCTEAAVVTDSRFTQAAKELGASSNVTLLHFDEISYF